MHIYTYMQMAPSRVAHFFQFYPLLLLLTLLLLQTASTVAHRKQTLALRDPFADDPTPPALPWDFKTYFLNQTIDHFSYAPQSYITFEQKYVINHKYWPGPESYAPIIAYLGGEGPLEVEKIGFVHETAAVLGAMEVYIEHRFYGRSIPSGSIETAMENETTRGYFTSAQALADYAEVLLHIKTKFKASDSPIIVAGGSYGGMLAAWFRVKYPHIALGALASSAPILYFDNITPQDGFDLIVTKDFEDVSERCYQTIRSSWAAIDEVASKPDGLTVLSQKFQTCSQLNETRELKDFLADMYTAAAQYDAPPEYPVQAICEAIDEASNGTDILDRIFAGVVAYRGKQTCYDMSFYDTPTNTSKGWKWQSCSEMVMTIGSGGNDTLFQENSPFKVGRFTRRCRNVFGVPPNNKPTHWVTTYYGGHNIKLTLGRFGSNIVFSNGLRDPFSAGGVLTDLSESIVAVTTLNGSHCLDLRPAAKTDPDWLVAQRSTTLSIIKGWLNTYYVDLKALKK